MGRKPNPLARPYAMSPEAREQRREALRARWDALTDPAERSLPGRPRKKRGRARDSKGRFVTSK